MLNSEVEPLAVPQPKDLAASAPYLCEAAASSLPTEFDYKGIKMYKVLYISLYITKEDNQICV